MCSHFFHICRFCKSQYECTQDDWVCATINHDVNELMCPACELKEKDDFVNWLGSDDDRGQSVSLDDWENK